jgi:hypothetical protein
MQPSGFGGPFSGLSEESLSAPTSRSARYPASVPRSRTSSMRSPRPTASYRLPHARPSPRYCGSTRQRRTSVGSACGRGTDRSGAPRTRPSTQTELQPRRSSGTWRWAGLKTSSSRPRQGLRLMRVATSCAEGPSRRLTHRAGRLVPLAEPLVARRAIVDRCDRDRRVFELRRRHPIRDRRRSCFPRYRGARSPAGCLHGSGDASSAVALDRVHPPPASMSTGCGVSRSLSVLPRCL